MVAHMFIFRPVIDLYSSRNDLADVVDEKAGTVQAWWNRDSIPPYAFRRIAADALDRVQAGDDRFKEITLEHLLKLAEQRARKAAA